MTTTLKRKGRAKQHKTEAKKKPLETNDTDRFKPTHTKKTTNKHILTLDQ